MSLKTCKEREGRGFVPGPLGDCEVVREGVGPPDFWTLGRADPSESLAAEQSFFRLRPERCRQELCSYTGKRTSEMKNYSFEEVGRQLILG